MSDPVNMAEDRPCFGCSVAVSRDGQTLIVGAPSETEDGTRRGGAYVYTLHDTGWLEEARILDPSPGANATFGLGVSLSSDGNTAVIGAPLDRDGHGSGYLYTRDAGIWTMDYEFGPTNSDEFGVGLSLADDGSMLMASSHFENGPPDDGSAAIWAGAAYVFQKDEWGWFQEAHLHSPVSIFHGFFSGGTPGVALAGNHSLAVATEAQGLPPKQKLGWTFDRTDFQATSFSPLTAAPHDTLTIEGTAFRLVTSATIGGHDVPITPVSVRRLKLTVTSQAESGEVRLYTADGSVAVPGTFTLVPSPAVDELQPSEGVVGSSVVRTAATSRGRPKSGSAMFPRRSPSTPTRSSRPWFRQGQRTGRSR